MPVVTCIIYFKPFKFAGTGRALAMAYSFESQFGPASDPIDVAQFIQYANLLEVQSVPVFSTSPGSVAGYEALQQLPEELTDSIVAECRYVSYLISSLLANYRYVRKRY